MKKINLALLVFALCVAHAANASFILENSNGGNGYVTGSYPSFYLFGSDNWSDVENTTSYTDTFSSAQTITFDWTYTTYDSDGSTYDPAGYILNGVKTQLSTQGLPYGSSITGTTNVSLSAGDTFGWYVNSLDSSYGLAYINVVSAVPVPAAAWLMGSGLLGLLGLRRKTA